MSAIYLHIPYCKNKCPYCDFTSSVGLTAVVESDYCSAVKQELIESKQELQSSISTIYLGGGTPSLFSSEHISELLETIYTNYVVTDNCEVSIEVNPESLSKVKLQAYKEAGINRVSIGAQSFSDRKLQQLGRIHGRQEIFKAFENARAAGFTNINCDLIFGVQGETLADWRSDLNTIIELQPEHISAYALTIEGQSLFAQQGVAAATDGMQAQMFVQTQLQLGEAGYTQYEVSNYAVPNKECQHNLNYWLGGDYLGCGAGAHSYLMKDGKKIRRWNVKNVLRYYQERVEGSEQLSLEEVIEEFLLLRLRTKDGFLLKEYEELTGKTFNIDLESDLVEIAEGRVRVTPKGMLFVDTITSLF